jgi:TonB family protein
VSSNSSRRVFVLQLGLIALRAVGYSNSQGDEHKEKANAAEEKVYEVGGDVKSPKLVHYVEPAFSPKSKEAYVEGTVKISTVVTKAGATTNAQVLSGLNTEEDRTALEALKQWKFEPGTRNGQPVNVRVTVEISFHLL